MTELIQSYTASIYSAIHNDLLDLEYQHRNPGEDPSKNKTKKRRPCIYDIQNVVTFSQMWGSTALGFGGIGGAAMTNALTVCIEGPMGDWCVYFGGRFAYRIERPNEQFRADMLNWRMSDVGSSRKYKK